MTLLAPPAAVAAAAALPAAAAAARISGGPHSSLCMLQGVFDSQHRSRTALRGQADQLPWHLHLRHFQHLSGLTCACSTSSALIVSLLGCPLCCGCRSAALGPPSGGTVVLLIQRIL